MKPSQLVAALKLELANSTPISRKRWVLRIKEINKLPSEIYFALFFLAETLSEVINY